MEVRYFVVDADQQLRPVEAAVVEGLWVGSLPVAEVPIRLQDEFRLVTAVCDTNLVPRICYFLRAEINGGEISDQSRRDVYDSMSVRSQRRYDHPAAQHQFVGWPCDWTTQLAVVLDVPAAQLQKIGIGGPLVMSDLWGISVAKVLSYFESVIDE